MRYTCISVSQLTDSVAYFRLPGDSVNCVSNIFLDGELHLDIHESGTYLIMSSEFGTISGNFTKIVANVGTIIQVTQKNVTIIATESSRSGLSALALAIMVGFILMFCVTTATVWYFYRKPPRLVTLPKPPQIKMKYAVNPLRECL